MSDIAMQFWTALVVFSTILLVGFGFCVYFTIKNILIYKALKDGKYSSWEIKKVMKETVVHEDLIEFLKGYDIIKKEG